jgi:Sap-like sulfolipid-1-addressing protein
VGVARVWEWPPAAGERRPLARSGALRQGAAPCDKERRPLQRRDLAPRERGGVVSPGVNYVDFELVLVGFVAMLEPATLISSVLALVLGTRPLRTGSLFYLGGIGATLAVGVLAALVLGNVASSPTSQPKTWVSVLNLVGGILLLLYVVRLARRPSDPQRTAHNVERMHALTEASAGRILLAGALLANAGPFMLVAIKDLSELNVSTGQYLIDWIVFALASMLPLGLALVLLRLAPGRATTVLAFARGFVERRARAIAGVLLVALAISLLRDGIAGLTG